MEVMEELEEVEKEVEVGEGEGELVDSNLLQTSPKQEPWCIVGGGVGMKPPPTGSLSWCARTHTHTSSSVKPTS